MSLKAWKEKYYPIPADEVSKEDAVQHSLTKWMGLLDIEDYDLYYGFNELTSKNEDAHFLFGHSSCALCHHYTRTSSLCTKCPLYEVRGEVKCHETTSVEGIDPYNNPNPRAMINWLKKALEYEKGKTEDTGQDVEDPGQVLDSFFPHEIE